MKRKRDIWEELFNHLPEQLQRIFIKNSNTLTETGQWPNKDPKDDEVIALVTVTEKLLSTNKSVK